MFVRQTDLARNRSSEDYILTAYIMLVSGTDNLFCLETLIGNELVFMLGQLMFANA